MNGTKFRTVDLVYVSLFAGLTALCAWVSVPATVEFTMQTFGVYCALAALGGRRGTAAVAVYLALGAVGAPVFAGFTGGLGPLLGVTGGYLVGFLFTGFAYWLVTGLLGERLPAQLLALTIGTLLCYAFGTAWFMAVYARTTGPVGLGTALLWCVVPFVPFDGLKLALALPLARRLRKFLH